jgi:anti-anti-sigma factor
MSWTMLHPALGVAVRPDRDDVVLAVAGELDIATAPALERWLDEAAGSGARCRIDLGAVTFCGVAGARAISAVACRHQPAVRLAPVPAHLRRVLALARFPLPHAALAPEAPGL